MAFIIEPIVEVKASHLKIEEGKYIPDPDLLSTFPRDITDPGLFVVNLPI